MATKLKKAMIFAAGLGTRFKPWTNHHPKALAIINGKTLLQRNIEYLQSEGIDELVINVHHFAEQIIDVLQKNNGWGSAYVISDEQETLLDTGGGLVKAKKYLQEEEAFVTCNADILTDLSIQRIYQHHLSQQTLISFAVSERSTSRVLLFDESLQLQGWRNNTTQEIKGPAQNWNPSALEKLQPKAYSCIPVFHSSIFDKIESTSLSGKFSLIDVYLQLAATHKIMGVPHCGDRWLDVGKPEAVAKAETLFV